MSRGPGSLQRAIVDLLYEARLGRLSWEDLKRPFPFEVADKSFYRAIRALKKNRMIVDSEIHGERYIALPPGKTKEDEELRALAEWAVNSVAVLAKARGFPPHAVEKIRAGADPDEFRHLIFRGERK
jgi:pyruvate-formate lyase-activating enzyme